MLHVTKVILDSSFFRDWIGQQSIQWSSNDASKIAGLLEEWLNRVVPATRTDDDAYLTAFQDAREKALEHLDDQLQNGIPLSDAVEEALDTFLESLKDKLKANDDDLTVTWKEKFEAIRAEVEREAGRREPGGSGP